MQDISSVIAMSAKLEEQQRLVYELKEQFQSMEQEEKDLNEKSRILEAKLVVKDLREKIKVKSEAINQRPNRVKELEGKLGPEETVPEKEPAQVNTPPEEKPRRFF